ncbi:hypothetical protein QBC47DRAFT_385495 [Echria macrotheca]|uniref:Uncharacterized protein n=1 Tax=Echria macrotheca TaxID=438768 RepID=A0AAJ0B9P4_9PEZI|nr:hypothetical protein QBC47DRAFT_385495 [Echria macrotheca]
MQDANANAASVGARMLGEIEEASLDEILASLRTGFNLLANAPPPPPLVAAAAAHDDDDDDDAIPIAPVAPTRPPRAFFFPLPRLDELVTRHQRATQSATPLSISGRHHELLYVLVATLIGPPQCKAISVVDFDGRFDVLRLLATVPATSTAKALCRADLEHVYVLSPARGGSAHVARCVASMEEYMVYSAHASREREWWGTVVIGGGLNPAAATTRGRGDGHGHVAVTADWKGWLRVERAEVPSFRDMGVEVAMVDREQRERAVDEAGWVGVSAWGSYVFGRNQA